MNYQQRFVYTYNMGKKTYQVKKNRKINKFQGYWDSF